ncbi:SDR family NAD(P)-dependent oxidoreductase [Sorangium sp. So ce448]|uniref:SDR family NAD(P)-dependent oxidoreductase n=1 Tax=Sorangium sp. So ce448 TaxID=3133314 RepID=UPI003F61CF12
MVPRQARRGTTGLRASPDANRRPLLFDGRWDGELAGRRLRTGQGPSSLRTSIAFPTDLSMQDIAAGGSSGEDVQTWLVERLAAHLGVDARSIDVRERLTRYGLDSQGAVSLLSELSRALGRKLSPTLAWEYPTIEALARYLVSGARERGPADREPESEPIAVVGMACRFPKAPDPEAFWRLLTSGIDAITEPPQGRWSGPASSDAGASDGSVRGFRGGFLDSVDEFDPQFFGISPREASRMDPQQRLVLELSWEALEDAGLVAADLSGTRAGVFCGAIWIEYTTLIHRGGPEAITQHTTTGHHGSIIANRVSYTLGFNGPSMTIDSACSSALVAVHLACESLRRGESTVALAGGVNLNLLPESTLEVARFGGLSPDGRCFTFDARANGYVRGEGGGMVVLKRLSRAVADGDSIYCVIRGSAVNNDGASNGLTAPNPRAQEELLTVAYERAGIDPATVHYVEAHGTGTPLGDPIEAKALGAILGVGRPLDRPLLVGSAKTNVGHLEGAAGIVGLIKVAMAIQKGKLPPSLNYETPNPHIPFSDLRLQVQRDLTPWPEAAHPRTAGVSSFGLGGTNSHVVLQEWQDARTEVLPISGETREGLRAAVRRVLSESTAMERGAALSTFCAAAAHSAHAPHRLAVTARTHDEVEKKLRAFLDGEPRAGLSAAEAAPPPKVAFVFSGQGAQWFGMGRSLLRNEPVFRAKLAQCSRLVEANLGWSLLDELTCERPRSRLGEIDRSLPAIISIEIAISALWRSWGIEPAAVVGHSTGEIAAAHVAGVLTLEDAIRTICAYGRVIRRQRGKGAMGLVGLTWEQTAAALASRGGSVFRAIEHSVDSTVVSAEPAALDSLFEALEREGVFCRRVEIDVAPHSPLVDSLRDELFAALSGVSPRAGRIPVYSEVTGARLGGERFDAQHWVDNFGNQALFSTAINGLIGGGIGVFLEVSPHPLVKHAIESNLRRAGASAVVVASLRREEEERAVLLDTLGALHARGFEVRWEAIYRKRGDHARPLPIVLSAKTDEALQAQAARLRAHLLEHPDLALVDVAYSLANARSKFDRRATLVAHDRAGLLESLAEVGRAGGARGAGTRAPGGKLAILFTGQGSQRPGMGLALYREFPAFREALDEICDCLDRELERPLRDILFAPAGSDDAALLDQTAFAQTALFALEVALARLVQTWGIEPSFLAGHSIGEVVAAHVAGVLALADACTFVGARARLMQAIPRGGSMATLEASEEEVRAELEGGGARVEIAAQNGPASIVVAGDADAVLELAARFETRGRRSSRLRTSHAFHSHHMDGALEALGRVARGLTFHPPRIPIVSNVTGDVATAGELGSPDYWVAHVRRTVRWLDGIRTIEAKGVSTFLELGPHGVLSALGPDALSARSEARAAFVPALRKDRPEVASLTAAVGELHARGLDVDWEAFFAPLRPSRVDLPTYAFQRERFWLDAPSHAVSATGSRAGRFPLSGSRLDLPDGSTIHTLEIGPGAQPYLADHSVYGCVVVPGAFYVAVLLAVAESHWPNQPIELRDVQFVQALAFEGPGDRVTAHAHLTPTDAKGSTFAVQIATRVDAEWTTHATALIAPARQENVSPRALLPSDAGARGHDSAPDLRRSLEAQRVTWGPRWSWIRHLDHRPERSELAQLEAPEGVASVDAPIPAGLIDNAFGLSVTAHHLHAEEPDSPTFLPFAVERIVWDGREAAPSWAEYLARGDERRGGERTTRGDITLWDATGAPVAFIEGFATCRAPVERLLPSRGARKLYSVSWVEHASTGRAGGTWALLGADPSGVAAALRAPRLERYATLGALQEAVARGAAVPDVLLVAHAPDLPIGSSEELAAEAHRATSEALALIKAWLADPHFSDSRLVVVTEGAVAARPDEDVPGLVHAPIWGLVRSAQTEHPERRLLLVDLDRSDASRRALPGALDVAEPQLALREGRRLVPRLKRLSPDAGRTPRSPNGHGTVLVTGGTGALGALVARHLVRAHGVEHLLLVSRRGPSAPGAEALRQELEAMGAAVDVAAVDIADRDALRALLASIPGERPLTAVVHAAGAVDDTVLEALTPAQLRSVFGAKVDAAAHLDELTRGSDLAAFVLFSSISGLLGGAGQANYAAANTFLDALASRRRAQGLPAVSLGWGQWAEKSAMTANLSEADLLRIRRGGIRALSSVEGLALFDAALEHPQALLAAVDLDIEALRRREDRISPLLRMLVGPAPSRAAHASAGSTVSLKQRLEPLSPEARHELLRDLVRAEIAAVLALGPNAIDVHRPLRELGLDSLTAVELRDRLAATTGLRLPATVLFDYPTCDAMAGRVLTGLFEDDGGLSELDRLELALSKRRVSDAQREVLKKRLRSILSKWTDGEEHAAALVQGDLRGATNLELFELIDKQLEAEARR